MKRLITAVIIAPVWPCVPISAYVVFCSFCGIVPANGKKSSGIKKRFEKKGRFRSAPFSVAVTVATRRAYYEKKPCIFIPKDGRNLF